MMSSTGTSYMAAMSLSVSPYRMSCSMPFPAGITMDWPRLISSPEAAKLGVVRQDVVRKDPEPLGDRVDGVPVSRLVHLVQRQRHRCLFRRRGLPAQRVFLFLGRCYGRCRTGCHDRDRARKLLLRRSGMIASGCFVIGIAEERTTEVLTSVALLVAAGMERPVIGAAKAGCVRLRKAARIWRHSRRRVMMKTSTRPWMYGLCLWRA